VETVHWNKRLFSYPWPTTSMYFYTVQENIFHYIKLYRFDDGGSKHLRNVCQFLWDRTAQHVRWQLHSYSPPWGSEIPQYVVSSALSNNFQITLILHIFSHLDIWYVSLENSCFVYQSSPAILPAETCVSKYEEWKKEWEFCVSASEMHQRIFNMP
jgi:hypothetical protein